MGIFFFLVVRTRNEAEQSVEAVTVVVVLGVNELLDGVIANLVVAKSFNNVVGGGVHVENGLACGLNAVGQELLDAHSYNFKCFF